MPKTIKEHQQDLHSCNLTCRWCGASLTGTVQHYDHSGGVEVLGFSEKQWLYTEWPECDYQWSWAKLRGWPKS